MTKATTAFALLAICALLVASAFADDEWRSTRGRRSRGGRRSRYQDRYEFIRDRLDRRAARRHESDCEDVTVAEVEDIIAKFQSSIETLDVDDTVALWAEDGRILGTVDERDTNPSNDGVRIGIDEVKDYFVGFIGADSPYVSVVPRFPATISPIDVQQLGNGFAAYSGYWNIDFETTEGALIEGFAKFTFVFERQSGGDLEIVLLNSGLTPTGLVVIEEAPAPTFLVDEP